MENMIIRKGSLEKKRSHLALATGFMCLMAFAIALPAFAAPAQEPGTVTPKAAVQKNQNQKQDQKTLTGSALALSLLREVSALERVNKLDEAIAKTKESITADPSCMPAKVQLGNLFIKKGQLDKAMKVFENALKQNPELHAAKTGEGVILFKKGDLQGALADLKEALELNPNPVLAYYELGNVYLKMGQPQKALEAYKKGIEKLKQGRHAW